MLEPKGMTLGAGVDSAFRSLLGAGRPGPRSDPGDGRGESRQRDACRSCPRETFVPFNGTMTLIDNDGTDPMVGTFAGLPEGTTS